MFCQQQRERKIDVFFSAKKAQEARGEVVNPQSKFTCCANAGGTPGRIQYVPALVKKPGAFFFNAQNTIDSVRETVSQRVMNFCTRQYYIRSQLSRLSPSILFDI
jgi:hypothetical protein